MIKMTITTDIRGTAEGYTGVKKHNEHDPAIKNPSNKDILSKYTKYNTLENGRENHDKITDWQEQQFGDWLEKYNAKQREKDHAERQIKSVKAWLKGKKKYTGVLTLGSMETTNELMRLLVPAEALETRKTADGEDRVYIKLDHPEEAKKFYSMYDIAFNKWLGAMDNPAFTTNFQKIGRHAMHVDELGAPHLHYEAAFAGKTAKGRPTPAVDAALKTFWQAQNPKEKVPSSRHVWSWYRSIMDEIGARALNTAIKDVYGKEDVVKMIRKSKEDPTVITGLTMEQVKAIHAEKAKAKATVDKLKAEISAQEKKKAQLSAEVKEKEEEVKTLDDQILLKDAELETKQAQASALDKTIKRHKEEKKTVETELDELKERKQAADQELKHTQTHHQTVMAGWKEDEEAAQARHDKLLAKNSSLEQENVKLRATKTGLQTEIKQQRSVLDQITNQLTAWVTIHLKNLMNLADNVHKGFYWSQQNSDDMNAYETDQADDIDRLTHDEDVPKRYSFDKQRRQWKRTVYQRKQRNLRERTGITDYTRHDDGPSL